MQVTAQIQARVIEKLKQGIALAEAAYGMKFAMPKVVYEKRGTVAGTANYRTWTIDLNAGLLMRNIEDFIARTVPHELAHLITDRVYPEAHRPVGAWFERTKREVHGPKWQSVCDVLGMTDVTRCHKYDTTETKVIKSNGRQIDWTCTGCGHVLQLTPKKSSMLDASPKSLWHRGCRGALLVRGITVNSYIPPAAKAPMSLCADQPKPAAPMVPAGVSKIDQCKKLYMKYSMLSRAEIIAKFVTEAGCTPAGGATYYATCKKAYG